MEILNQITVLVSNPPQGSGNLRRLKKGFEKATASTHGFMDFGAFSKAIRYPLKFEVQRKLFSRHFDSGELRGLNYDRFLTILKRLDQHTREDRIEEILNFYGDENGMISFEDFKNIIAVALQQIDFQIGEVELHRLVETILQYKDLRYKVDDIRKSIRRWNSLDKRIGDILYLALFLEPKVPLDTAKHNNRFPSVFRPRSSASKCFLFCILLLYVLAVTTLTMTVWTYTWTSLAVNNNCDKRIYDRWKSHLLTLNRSYSSPLRLDELDALDKFRPENVVYIGYKNVVTELLNFHLLFASLLTLKSMKVALCRRPLCAYLNREDVRLVLWIVAFSIGVLCVSEYVLIFSRSSYSEVISEYLNSSRFLFSNPTVNQAASALKMLMIGLTLLIRIPGVRNRLVHFTLDLGEPNLNVFIAIHLLQDESFLKWAIPLLVSYVVDCHSFAQIKQTSRSLDANFCMTSGGLIVTTSRRALDFLLGDIFFLIVDQVAVSSIVPAWVISPPSDKSRIKLLLHEGHWQTKVLRQLLKKIKNEVRDWNLSSDGKPQSATNRSGCQRLRQRNVVILSNSGDSDPAQPRWPHATTMQVSTNLHARIIGPFRSVHFELYTKYSSVMLLITPKSAGAVLAYLQQHSETASGQKVVLVFAASEFRRVEWFIASLVRLELSEMARHSTHGRQNRSECESCRMFFLLYLTSASSGQDARIMWVQLAMAVLAGENSALIQHLQNALHPDLNAVKPDNELFQELEFLLCDADFPYADTFIGLSKHAEKEIRHF